MRQKSTTQFDFLTIQTTTRRLGKYSNNYNKFSESKLQQQSQRTTWI